MERLLLNAARAAAGSIALLFAISLLAMSAAAAPDTAAYEFDIGRAPLKLAMHGFVEQTSLQYYYFDERIPRLLVGPVQGHFTPGAALDRLLRPAGLTFE